MKKNFLLIITLSVACLFSEMRVRAQVADRVVVSYVTSWSTEVPDSRTMTHINFAFGGVNSSHNGVSLWSTDRLKMLVGLKQKNPSLKVLVSIGGWGGGRLLSYGGRFVEPSEVRTGLQACLHAVQSRRY